MAAIACHNVRRVFGETTALDGVSLTIDKHQIFGLLGPNGSGKTTLLNQIQGLDVPTSGNLEVLGLDPIHDHDELVTRLGSQHQETTSIPRLTVRETVTLFASFYEKTRDPDGLIESLGLVDKAGTRLENLSGGQRQRVFIALALVHDPELLLFDELTSALDPNIKRAIWDILKELRAEGRTILLTTHSMEEAEELCDRVAIIDAGRILAEGSPRELVERFAPAVTLLVPVQSVVDPEELSRISGVGDVSRDGDFWRLTGDMSASDAVYAHVLNSGGSASEIRTQSASLEDVFIQLTGRKIAEVCE